MPDYSRWPRNAQRDVGIRISGNNKKSVQLGLHVADALGEQPLGDVAFGGLAEDFLGGRFGGDATHIGHADPVAAVDEHGTRSGRGVGNKDFGINHQCFVKGEASSEGWARNVGLEFYVLSKIDVCFGGGCPGTNLMTSKILY